LDVLPRFVTGLRNAGVFAVLLLALGGCESLPDIGLADFSFFGGRGDAWPVAGAVPALPAVPAGPVDPLVTFAAAAAPGGEQMLTLADGRTARVRLLRSYAAASGRECREVAIGGGFEERASLVCRDGEVWALARPLLRGGGGRP
jgi:hypothetical protein